MKLHELGASRQTEQIAKVFESHMGTRVDFDRLSAKQARGMLERVRDLIREHRSSPSIHFSERNPDYIKLVMMEQGLVSKLNEQPVAAPGAAAADVQKAAALAQAQQQERKKQIQDAIRLKQKEIQQLQQQMNNPAAAVVAENRRRLREGEVQQAQVVMAAQDMVDQMQKILEQVSAMQFKDLPALTDAIKNDTGVEQATQFQTDSSAALTALLSAVQQAKTQLEAAQGVLTGQAPIVPGTEPGADLDAAPAGDEDDLGADLGLDANLPGDEDEEEFPAATLGRERR